MYKKVIIMVAATMMIISSMAVVFGNGTVNTSRGIYAPSQTLGNAFTGNVTIYSNGTVSNSTVITPQSGNAYAISMNISGTVTDLRNGSLLDGNGFYISAGTGTAVYLNNTTGVTLKGINVTGTAIGLAVFNSYGFNLTDSNISVSIEGMYSIASSNLTINNDNITTPGTYGIYLQKTPELYVNGTTINAINGVHTDTSTSSTVFTNDVFNAVTYAIYLGGSVNNNIVVENSQLTATGAGGASNGLYDNSIVSYNGMISNDSFTNFKGTAVKIDLVYGANFTVQNSKFLNDTSDVYFSDVMNILVVNNHFSGITGKSVYYAYCLNDTTSSNTFVNFTSASSEAVFLVNNGQSGIIDHNTINPNATIASPSVAIGVSESSKVSILNNTITNSSTAIHLDYVASGNIIGNHGNLDATGVNIVGYSMDNVNISRNSFLNGSLTGYGIYVAIDVGTNWVINNNHISNAKLGISISYDIVNITIDGNYIYNVVYKGIYTDYNNNISVSGNTVVMNSTLGTLSLGAYGIDFEFAILGATISNNVVIGNNTTNGEEGILVHASAPVLAFNNTVTNTTYALDIEYSGIVRVFNNQVNNTGIGIYSLDNFQNAYYGNSIVNSLNTSFYSAQDYGINVFGNTFQSSGSYMVVINSTVNMTFYHNNFINGTSVNVSISGATNILWNLALPVGGNYWSNYTGPFSNGIGTIPYAVTGTSVDYLPLEHKWTGYTVTFVESGLPAGTTWSVNLGSSLISTDTASILFNPQAAQPVNQTFTVGSVSGYVASSTSGNVFLNGNSQVITITFTPYKYGATFTESNLPAGTSWSVTLNGITETSTTSTVTFSVPNGTYSYTIGSVTGYHTSAASGTITVNTASQSVSVQFTRNTYILTVNELGLPSGDSWTFTLNGTQHTSTTNVIALQVTSGTYTLNASGPTGYNVSVQNSLTVNNANASVTVTFSAFNTTTPPPAKTSSAGLYIGLGVGVVIGAVVASIAMMFYTGTGVFSSLKKGKGGNP